MQGKKRLFLMLVLGLGLAASAAFPAVATAEPSLTVVPARPLPTDRPVFTLVETDTSGPCSPDFLPLPTIAGNLITFHGTRTIDPPPPNCQATYRNDWQLDPLPAGTYTARVEVNGLQITTLDFQVGTGSLPPLSISPAHPNQRSPITFTVSGTAVNFCPPFLQQPVVQGTNIIINGQDPLFPVVPECQGPWSQDLSIPPLLPGTYQVSVQIDSTPYATETLVVDLLNLPPALFQIDPRLPTTRDRITLTAGVVRNCPVTFGLPVLTGDHIVFPATLGSPCNTPTVGQLGQATIGPLPAGAYLVELDVDGLPNELQGMTVTAPATVLPLVDHRFAVTVDRGGPALAVPLTDESGYFWFFDPTNIELTVKILDGRAVNGHYWVFIASMTDLPYTVSIEDLGSSLCGTGGTGCPVKTYTAVGGKNGNFIDLGSL